MHAKLLSPAAEAFRYFVLETGGQMLAGDVAAHTEGTAAAPRVLT
jgi:hypothetical protein